MTPPTENLMNSELTLLYNTPTVLYCACKVLHNTDVFGILIFVCQFTIMVWDITELPVIPLLEHFKRIKIKCIYIHGNWHTINNTSGNTKIGDWGPDICFPLLRNDITVSMQLLAFLPTSKPTTNLFNAHPLLLFLLLLLLLLLLILIGWNQTLNLVLLSVMQV